MGVFPHFQEIFQLFISVWTFLPNSYGSREKAEKFLENEEKHP
jgi:hypothetical protein